MPAHSRRSRNKPRALLIYDNVRPLQEVRGWLPSPGLRCQVLITTEEDAPKGDWSALEVPPLSAAESRQLIEALAGPAVPRTDKERLAHFAGGLPGQLRERRRLGPPGPARGRGAREAQVVVRSRHGLSRCL